MVDELNNDQLSDVVWKDWYLAIQGFFYFVQGAAFGFTFLLVLYLQEKFGITPVEALSAQGLMLLPWYIKIVFGILSDKVPIGKMGRRRPYIIIAGIMGMVGWFVLPTVNTYGPIVIVLGIMLAGSIAIADTVLDSLAVDITPANRRGHMQGVGWGFRGLGAGLAGWLLSSFVSDSGWNAAFILLGSLVVVGCFSIVIIKEPKQVNNINVDEIKWSSFKTEFKKPVTWLMSLYNLFGGAGIAIISVLSLFLNSEQGLGIELEGVGIGVSLMAFGQFVGALTFGYIGQKLPFKPVYTVNVVAYAALIMSTLILPFNNVTVVYIFLVVFGILNGGFEAGQMRLSMENSVGPLAGTLYGWFMSMSNVGQIAIGAIVIGAIADSIGGDLAYPIAFQFASLFLLLTLPIAYRSIKKYNQNMK